MRSAPCSIATSMLAVWRTPCRPADWGRRGVEEARAAGETYHNPEACFGRGPQTKAGRIAGSRARAGSETTGVEGSRGRISSRLSAYALIGLWPCMARHAGSARARVAVPATQRTRSLSGTSGTRKLGSCGERCTSTSRTAVRLGKTKTNGDCRARFMRSPPFPGRCVRAARRGEMSES